MRRLAQARKPQDRGIFDYASTDICDDGLAGRQAVRFACSRGHEFTVTFADDVELPGVWECRQHGTPAELKNRARPQPPPEKVRTLWDMLLERRSERELARLLDEQLRALRAGRLLPMEEWLQWSRDQSRKSAGHGAGATAKNVSE